MPSEKLDNHIFKWFLFLGPCEIVVVFRVCGPVSEAFCEIVIVRVMWNCGCPLLVLGKNQQGTTTIPHDPDNHNFTSGFRHRPANPKDNHNFTWS